jgi:glycerol-3-phosphate cytidylyltransferase
MSDHRIKPIEERVGIIASCFDLFHAGHVLALYEASEHCDRLVVALQSDPTLDRLEKNKPIQGMFERFTQVNSCKYVDQVIPYDTENDLYNLLAGYDWDVRFLGSDYYGRADFTGHDLDIPIHYCSRKHNYSSSGLRTQILNAAEPKIKTVKLV